MRAGPKIGSPAMRLRRLRLRKQTMWGRGAKREGSRRTTPVAYSWALLRLSVWLWSPCAEL